MAKNALAAFSLLFATLFQVRAQLDCYVGPSCEAGGGTSSPATSARDCCLRNLTQAMSYALTSDPSSACQPCIVIGFVKEYTEISENIRGPREVEVQVLTPVNGLPPEVKNGDLFITAGVNLLSSATFDKDFRFPDFETSTLTYSGTIAFLPWTIRFQLVDDEIPGEVEQFTLEMTSAMLSDTEGQQKEVVMGNSLTVAILDNDVIEVQFKDAEFSADESAETKEIFFIIDNPIIVDTHFILLVLTYQQFDEQYEKLNATYPGLDQFTLGDEYDQAEPADFTSTKIPFTIPATKIKTNGSVNIILNDDNLVEPKEEGLRLVLTVDESRTNLSEVKIDRQLALFRIDDRNDSITIGFEFATQTIDEPKAGTQEDFIARLFVIGATEIPIFSPLTVGIESTATKGEHFGMGIDFQDFSGAQLKINGSEIEPEGVDFLIFGDDIFEGDEDIVVSLTLPPHLVLPLPFKSEKLENPSESEVLKPNNDQIIFVPAQSRITIRGGGRLFVNLSVPEVIHEGESFFPRVSVSEKVEAEFELSGVPSGSASRFDDFVFFTQRISFAPPNVTNQTSFSADIKPDNLVEPNETFNIEVKFVDHPSIEKESVTINNPTATVTIIDGNIAIIGFSETMLTVDENDGEVVLAVAVQEDRLASNAEVKVKLSTMTGTAGGSDFVQVSDMELVFNGDKQEYNVPINIASDAVFEDLETFTASLSMVSSNVNLNVTPSEATISIRDDERMQIGFKDPTYVVYEVDGSISFEVEVKNNVNFEVPLDFTVTDTPGEAQRMMDYVGLSNVALQLQPGQTSVKHDVTIVNDDVIEPGTETFTLNLQSNHPRIDIMAGYANALVTITDNDTTTIGFDEVVYEVLENATFVQVCVSVLGKSLADNKHVQVMLTSTDMTAKAPNDYKPVAQELTLTSVVPSSCVNISIKQDDILEEDEIFVISLTSNDSYVYLSPKEANTVIMDDGDVVEVGFKSGHYIYDENDEQAFVEVVLIGQTEVAVTVSVNGGPSTQTEIGTDRVVFNGTVTFTATGLTPQTIIEPIINDDVALEDNETFVVSLNIDPPVRGASVISSTSVGAFPDTEVTIVDDDVVEVKFTNESNITVDEGVGMFEVCVKKNLQTIKDLTIDVVSRDQTAYEGLDYNLSDPTVVIPKNSLQKCFSVDIIDDSECEEDEKFFLDLSDSDDERVLLESPFTLPVTIVDNCPRARVCTLYADLVLNTFRNPFETGQNFSLSEGCEHKLVTSCDEDVLDLEIRVDFLKHNFSSTKLAIIYKGETVIIDENLSLNPTTPPTNEIDYQKDANHALVSIPQIMLTITRSLTEVTITSRNDTLPSAGLCGGMDGKLYFHNCSEAVVEGRKLKKFKKSYRVNPSDQILSEERRECGLTTNDTVIGDPLMTVPINVPIDGPEYLTDLHLCYEIHGAKDKYFNFVSDECTSVNAHYVQAPVSERLNVIDSMSFVAIDKQHTCHKISVDVSGCSATVDGNTLQPMSGKRSMTNSTYEENGISVRSYTSRVRISVPNCADNSLVMWAFCQQQPLQDPDDGSYTAPVDMIKFEITRGLNLKETSHGLLGQFWNIPVKVGLYAGAPKSTLSPGHMYFTVNVTHPHSAPRTFTGIWNDFSWEFESKKCLYVGNNQGGPSWELDEPDDSVIEGVYEDYMTADAFETDFKYAVFKNEVCP